MSLVGVGFLRNSLLAATDHPKAPKTLRDVADPFYSYSSRFHEDDNKEAEQRKRREQENRAGENRHSTTENFRSSSSGEANAPKPVALDRLILDESMRVRDEKLSSQSQAPRV